MRERAAVHSFCWLGAHKAGDHGVNPDIPGGGHPTNVCFSGDLAAYVKEELNVAELGAADPDEYGSVSVQPNFAVLGKKLGKDVKAVSAALRALSMDDVQTFRSKGELTVEGHTLGSDDVRSPAFIGDAYNEGI